MVDLDVRLLRAFIAVAEELNFSRAAERMGLAQQGLSAQVRQLESRLGATVFTRTTRRVALTPAGEALLPHARAALAEIEAGVEAVRRHEEQAAGQLAVAGLADGGELAELLVERFAERRPDVSLAPNDSTPPQALLDDASGKRAAVAFVWPPFRGINRFSTVVLASEPRCFALPAAHELATRDTVAPSELMDETWAWVGGPDRVAEAFWLLEDHRFGRAPRLGGRPATWEELLALVAGGRAIGVVPQSVARTATVDGVSFVAATGVEPATLVLAWRPAAETEAIRELAEVARDLIR